MSAAPTLPTLPDVYGPDGRSPWLDVDWRTHQRWEIIDGQTVNTIELGSGGPTLVFVHGLSGSWPNWLEQLPVFAADHHVLTLDLPGFGHSPMPSEPITIAGYVRLLDQLLEQRNIDSAVLVGSSMGGLITAELALEHPARVERLVLVSAAGLSTHAHPRAVRAVPTLKRLEKIVAGTTAWAATNSDTITQRARLRNATLNFILRHPSRLPAALAAEQMRGAGKPGFIPALQNLLEYDLSERLGEITCPTLVVWGDRDRVITVRDTYAFAKLIPHAREEIFEDTGHLPALERPGAFNALLREFLAEPQRLAPA